MYRHDQTSSGMALGLLSGAIIGASLALLFTPKTGRAIRDDLSRGVGSLRDAIGEHFERLADQAGVEVRNLKATVEHVATDVEQRARKFVDSADSADRNSRTSVDS